MKRKVQTSLGSFFSKVQKNNDCDDERATLSCPPAGPSSSQIDANGVESQASALEKDAIESQMKDSTSEQKWPVVWTEKQVKDFTSNYPWLFGKNGCLGCSTCKDAGLAPAHRVPGMTFPEAWCKATVQPYGTDRATQLKALRKKICDHKESKVHQFSVDVLSKRDQDFLPNVMNQATEEEYETTARVFRTAYFLMKRERPFTDFPHLVDLQQMNSVEMGSILHSRVTAAEICDHIGNEMRKKLVSAIKSSGEKIAVMIDEATTKSQKPTLVICLRVVLNGQPTSMYFDLIELEKADSQTIVNSLLGSLNKHGMDNDYLKEHLICFASDGASVMTGRASGVATKLKEIFPTTIFWHCANHKLELAVNDCVSSIGGINNFKIFMDKLYSLYSASPKNRTELRQAAEALESELQKIGRMLDTRWVASSYRAASAVIRSYSALAQHLSTASSDPARDSRERSKYSGMLSYLTSKNFVLNLALMADALQELSTLSLALLSRGITFVEAHKKIKILIVVFIARKEKPGAAVEDANKEIAEHNTFKGGSIALHKYGIW